jgi:hypothetical protein
MRRIALVGVFALWSCQTQQPAESKSTPAAAPAVRSERDAESPIRVTVRATSEREHEATLEIAVTKVVATEQPLALSLRLPAGVDAAPAALTAVEGKDTGRFVQTIQLKFGATPSTDLFVVADSQGTSFGYHAEVPYRFGRPEPTVSQPVRSPDTVKMGGIPLGQPVELTPPASSK